MDATVRSPLLMRAGILLLVLANPLLFAVGYSIFNLASTGQPRFAASLLGELAALALFTASAMHGLAWLWRHRFETPGRAPVVLVNVMSCVYVVIIAVNVVFGESSGLLSAGGRLDFYFENDWYRRIITFSTVPAFIATYHAVHGLLSPVRTSRRALLWVNLLLLLGATLMQGSKGAGLLIIAATIPFAFSARRVPIVKIGLLVLVAAAVYVMLYLLVVTDKYAAILGMFQRFYLSIDMSILLQNRGLAEALADRLSDVWIEVFRSSVVLGTRVSEMPIGAAVYQYAFGVVPSTGANCRFGSLLLLYPDRLDFLVGFPILLAVCAWLLQQILRAAGLGWSAYVAIPYFFIVSSQDVYLFASHVVPLVMLAGVVCAGRRISNMSVRRSADAGQDRHRALPGASTA